MTGHIDNNTSSLPSPRWFRSVQLRGLLLGTDQVCHRPDGLEVMSTDSKDDVTVKFAIAQMV